MIKRVVQKTGVAVNSESNDQFYYLAYTNLGDICNIGVLDLTDVKDRQRGALASLFLNIKLCFLVRFVRELTRII